MEPVVVQAVRRDRHSHEASEQNATLALLSCLTSRGIDFSKLDADKTFMAHLLAQPQQQSVACIPVLAALVNFVAVAIEELPHLVPDAAGQDFVVSALQLPLADLSVLQPLVTAVFRSPQAELTGLRDVITQRLMAMLDTDRSALLLLGSAVTWSFPFTDRYRALSAHAMDALLRLSCADRYDWFQRKKRQTA